MKYEFTVPSFVSICEVIEISHMTVSAEDMHMPPTTLTEGKLYTKMTRKSHVSKFLMPLMHFLHKSVCATERQHRKTATESWAEMDLACLLMHRSVDKICNLEWKYLNTAAEFPRVFATKKHFWCLTSQQR